MTITVIRNGTPMAGVSGECGKKIFEAVFGLSNNDILHVSDSVAKETTKYSFNNPVAIAGPNRLRSVQMYGYLDRYV